MHSSPLWLGWQMEYKDGKRKIGEFEMEYSLQLKHFRKVWGNKIMEGFESVEETLKLNMIHKGKLVELFKNWSCVL